MSTQLYFTTIDGTPEGRASYFHRSMGAAEIKLNAQNDRATSLGIKARYKLAEIDSDGIENKEIRD